MTTRTTVLLSISRGSLALASARAWLLQRDPLAVLAIPALLLIIGVAFARQLVSVPTAPSPVVIVATAPAVRVPTAAPIQAAAVLPHTLARAVVAYDAPDGRVIGAIDQGHAYRVVARFGVDWIQAAIDGSGMVWLRAADLFDLPQGLADLRPTDGPITVYVSAPPVPAPPPNPPAAALEGRPIVMTADQQAAVDREFGLTSAELDAAFLAHQAREAAFADGQNARPAPVPPLTSEDLPCNCP